MSPAPELFYLALTLLVAGGLAGFTAGLFGIGGGAIIIPVIYYTFSHLGYSSDVVMHSAVATSAAVIVVNSARSLKSHHAHGSVQWDLLCPNNPLQSYALWVGIGSFVAASWLAPRLSGHLITIIFATVACLTALQFLFGRPEWVLRKGIPGGMTRPIVGGGVGVLSSLIGIGGGSLTVPLMTICGISIHKAIATASGFGLAIAVPSTIGFIISGWGVSGTPLYSIGYVNVLGFVLISILAFFTIPLGASLAHKLSQKKLRFIFGVTLLLISVNMTYKALSG